MGVQEDVNENAPATVIPLISHCGDMGSVQPTEAPEVTESKLRVTKLAKEWLGIERS